MSATDAALGSSGHDEAPPPELLSLLGHFGLGAGNANVIMQLSRLPVGHGVANSRVDSGRVDKHPIKRLRTTVTYLAIALLGSEHERAVMRQEVNRAHAQVRSRPGDTVAYDAFDPELQLWVAACLYRGAADVYRKLNRADRSREGAEALYQYSKRLGSTLQVADEMWPTDLDAFADYWQASLSEIHMDELTRTYLRRIAQLEFIADPLGPLGSALRPLLRPLGAFLTLGWLPEPFRAELGLPWSARQQRLFELHIRTYAAITRRLPRLLREVPVNVYFADARRRIRQGRRIV